MFDIPILFIIFKRKETALQSFQRIKKIKPSRLYIACDGPRKQVSGEDVQVEDTRNAILQQIDWDCQTRTLFQSDNLGCALGVYTAIEWLFQNEPYGIILEDDCVASISFFHYVKELLFKYQSDERIGMIAGTNQIAHVPMKESYCFSRYAACWGWATWQRAWKNMQLQMHFLKNHQEDVMTNRGYCGKENQRWVYQLKMISKQYVSAWDWQWYFSLAAQNQLCIFPSVNLISNIGNDTAATHTGLSNIYIERQELTFPLTHPSYIVPSTTFDRHFYRSENTILLQIKRNIPYQLKKQIKRVIFKLRK